MEHEAVIKEIAAERILILYDMAVEQAAKDIVLSKLYVRTLRRISSRYKVHLPEEMKGRICRTCNLVLIPGLTASVRLASSKGYMVYRCNICKGENHIFYRTDHHAGRRPGSRKKD